GVPVHAADSYVKRLAEAGHRVAICEQVDNPSLAARSTRGLVRREVVEVITPGLVGDPSGVDATAEVSLVALAPPGPGEREFGLAALDASTGDFRATQIAVAQEEKDAQRLPAPLGEEIARIAPREILIPRWNQAALAPLLQGLLPGVALSALDDAAFARPADAACAAALANAEGAASRAAAALLGYLKAHQPFALVHTARLRPYQLSDTMILDAPTRAHLELFASAEDGSRHGTLFERIDQTRTPAGARRLARWLAYPLLSPRAIAARQEAVAWLAERDRARGRLREALRSVRDLERLLAKAARPSATPRDLVALRGSLEVLPSIVRALEVCAPSPGEEGTPTLLRDAEPRPGALPVPTPVPEAVGIVAEGIVDDPPAMLRGSRGAAETGFIRPGYCPELDSLRESARKGREWIAGLEEKERARTAIPGLRVRYHPVHGYGIEVTKSNLGRVPTEYERKQTLASAERFTTPELREMERSVVGAHERAAALEREIFESLRQGLLEHASAIRAAAEAVAEIDALQALAEVARRDSWVRPEVREDLRLQIRAGRHPVVETLAHTFARGAPALPSAHPPSESTGFVPNDTDLDPESTQILLLTGPNMSGKSTYLRQVALIVLLAQMGSFVPADSAQIGVVDRIFTRIGASDRLARGESTFMVEMRETAQILAQASRRSLIILDEIGRGTSTFDGLSIAWAVAEHLHDCPGQNARTLFATHFHELTDLAATKPRVRNAHFEAREWEDDVIFLRRLVPGGASRSYGIQVAKLAGLPAAVVARGREVLANLEGGELDDEGRPRLSHRPSSQNAELRPSGDAGSQLGLFREAADADETEFLGGLMAELRALDLDRTTPLDALTLLARIVGKLREKEPS
ncbi:MAG TPA: DNA mismatch repair protein MutS, partial [Deltaproteobacteria bacterium]|nr:DNA mismatch repair protein MutS [Deltaproteobacteria bacterium]